MPRSAPERTRASIDPACCARLDEAIATGGTLGRAAGAPRLDSLIARWRGSPSPSPPSSCCRDSAGERPGAGVPPPATACDSHADPATMSETRAEGRVSLADFVKKQFI